MKIINTEVEGVVIIEPQVYYDNRGYFSETFKEIEFQEKVFQKSFIH